MKSPLVLLSLILNLTLFGQAEDEFEVISLSENQKYSLNSQSRIGGTTRSHLFVNLPPNTVSWIYMLTTSKSATPAKLNLLPQVIKLIPHMGVTSTLLSSLTFPAGESTINAYLIDGDQFSNFTNDNKFTYYPPASRMAFNSGPVKVDYPFNSGQYYIGLENPAAISAVNIVLDVVAIVKKNAHASLNNSNQANKSGLQTILETFQNSLEKPANQTTNTNSTLSSKNNTTINNENIERKDDDLTRKISQALNIGNLGWYAYERGDINGCIEKSKKSISLYPFFFVKANLGLCYLVKGDDSSALDEYVGALEVLETEEDQKKSLKGAIKDIEDAKAKRKLNPIADDILRLLRSNL